MGPVPRKLGDTGAEGPEISPRIPGGRLVGSAPGDRSRTAGRTGGEGPEMRQRDDTAYVEGGPPQRPARPLVLAAILLPSAAAQWSWAILPFWH